VDAFSKRILSFETPPGDGHYAGAMARERRVSPPTAGSDAPTPRSGSGQPPRAGGELALIAEIRRRSAMLPAARGGELRLGIGDDCAILRPRAGEEIVITTDFTLEGRHFRRDWHPPASVGHRALARGLSDLAAMGSRPSAAFLSLALPRAMAADREWVDGFLQGLMDLAKRVRVPLAGGDTAEAPGEYALADIVLGAVPAGRALRRGGARPGDRLFCSGALGGAAAELRALAAGGTAGEELDHPQLFPEPRLELGQALRRRGLASAAIDLSDGLSTDLRHLCAASGVRAEVEADSLPLHRRLHGLERATALDLALNGGEDYELLFTAASGVRVPRQLGGVPLAEIGRMLKADPTKPTVSLVSADGSRSELVAGGWEHLQ